MPEFIGASKAWNPVEHKAYKYRGTGKVGEAASDVRRVEITPEMRARYEQG